jgi:SAM-dependent methyltransferase
MDNKTIKKILEINSYFYESYAKEFSLTRQAPWKGWSKLWDFLGTKSIKILDLGCGNGRFYKFLKENSQVAFDYIGVDISKSLVDEAKALYPRANFEVENFLIKNDKYLANFDVVVGFGVLHHIPDFQERLNFLSNSAGYLAIDGTLIMTFWTRFPEQKKQINVPAAELEKNDFLVEWDNDKDKYRYIHVFDNLEMIKIKTHMEKIGLKLISEFSSDGKDESSNVYLVWKKHD